MWLQSSIRCKTLMLKLFLFQLTKTKLGLQIVASSQVTSINLDDERYKRFASLESMNDAVHILRQKEPYSL